MTIVKICGLTSADAVHAVTAAKADFAGFVYFPSSPRHISIERAAQLKALLPPSIRAVAVLVDPDDALLAEAQSLLAPDFIQLHGQETPQRLREIKVKFPLINLMKAISVRSGDDVARAASYANVADMLMFDAKPPTGMMPGGNGLAFDWALLKGREFPLPWFLSGGLAPDNVAEAIAATDAKMVDVSSGVESAPGVKDATLVESFIKNAKSAGD